MASLLALGRHQIRRLYEIQGSGIEDVAAAALLYPQSLAQMMSQVSEKPVRRGYSRTPKEGTRVVTRERAWLGQVGRSVDI